MSIRRLTATAAPLIANTNVRPDPVLASTVRAPVGLPFGDEALHALEHYGLNQAPDATTSASTPASSVGWITGRNFGLWLVGMSLTLFAALALA